MTAFRQRVSSLTGLPEARLERLAGGDLSEVLLVRRPDGRRSVAKGGGAVAAEATMLRALAAAGLPTPAIEGEHDGLLLLSFVDNDRLFTASAWRSLAEALRRLHSRRDEQYGWPVDYRIGTVELDNRQGFDWPLFWGGQRLIAIAGVLDRPWRERVERFSQRLGDVLPAAPPPTLLHGDLWSGNILVHEGQLAALIDPACYYGDAEVDLAMLTLFDTPPEIFWEV